MKGSLLSSLLSRRLKLAEIACGDAGRLADAMRGHACVQNAAYSTAGQNFAATGSITDRIFAPYTIYKGKAALSLSPVLPTFAKLESGNGLKIDRQGTMMLKFWPAIAERKYDWEKRQLFALSATEIGAIISLGPADSCEFFHDPSMKSSNAGQVRKSLSVKPHQDGSGYFISISVVNNLLRSTDRLTVPVTTAEFAVMKTACSFVLPHIMGWDRYTSNQRPLVGNGPPKVEPRMLDSEWDR